jgi:uncharacterized membrane protein
MAASAAGALAVVLLLGVTGAGAARRSPRLLANTALVAAVVALASGLYFALGFPYEGARPGYGMALFLTGAVLGLAAAIAAVRRAATAAPA